MKAAFFLIMLGATLAPAQTTFTWTNNSSGFWSNTTKWAEGIIPATGGSNDYSLIFNNPTAVTATNDLGSFQLNRLLFAGTNITLRGSSLVFINNSSGAGPSLVVSNNKTYTIYNTLVLSNDLTVSSTVAGANPAVTVNGSISGPGSLILSNVAAGNYTLLALAAANTYDGGTRVYAGRLQLSNAAATLGTGDVTIASGAELYLSAAATISNNFFIAGNYAGDSLGALRLDSGATIRGVVNLTTNATIGTVSGTGNLQADVRGDYTVTKVGGGTLVLTGSNTYSGGTTVTAGSIQFDTLNSVPTSGQIFINTNGVLNATGAYTPDAWLTSNRLDPNSAGIFVLTAYNSAALNFSNYPGLWLGASGTVTNGGSIVAGGGAYRFNVAGTLVLTNDLALTGPNSLFVAGNVTLTGSNTFSGGTLLTNGILVANNNNALGTGNLTITNGATRFVVGDGMTITNNITIFGGGVSGRGLIENSGAGNATLSGGTITINGAVTAGGHFASTGGGTLTVNDYIISSVPFFSRSGTVIFGGGGSYTNFSISQGTAALGANNGLATNATLIIGASGTAIFDVNGRNQTLVGISKGSNPATITNSGSVASLLILTGPGTNTYAGNIRDNPSGTIAIQLTGGYQTLSGTNTYTGGTTITGGILQFGNTYSIPTGTTNLVVPYGATLAAGYAMDTNFINMVSAVSSGTVALAASSGSPLDFNTPGLANVSLGAAGGTYTNSGALTPFGTTYRLGGGGGTLVVSGVLTDQNATATSLLAFGSGSGGTVTLSQSNAYTGVTIVQAGTLLISHANALGDTAAGTVVTNGAQLALTGNITVNEPLTIYGQVSGTSGALQNFSGTNTVSAAITVGDATFTRIRANGGLLILSGGITGAVSGAALGLDLGGGTRSITVTNGSINLPGGTLQITGGTGTPLGSAVILATTNNAFSNLTIIWGATLKLGATDAIPTNVVLTVGGGSASPFTGTLDLNGFNQTVASLSSPTNSALVTNSTGAATLTLNQSANTTFNGLLAGPLALTKNGPGTLTLTGTNLHTGLTTINDGQLVLANPLALRSSTISNLTANGLAFSGITTANLGGLAGNGNITLTNDTGAPIALSVGTNNASTTYSGILSGDGASLTKAGSGTLILAGNQAYTGDTFVNTGTLSLATGGSVSSTNITVASGARLVFDRTDAFTNTTFVTGSGLLIKQGTGTLVLDATNNFAGQLLVQAGTVELPATATYASANATPIIVGGTLATSTLHLAGSVINLTSTGNNFNVGETNQNQFLGQVIQDDATLTSAGALRLALSTNVSVGVYTLNSGLLSLTNNGNSFLQIGRDGTGEFNQYGGTVTVARTSSGWGNAAILIGMSTNSAGLYTLTNGVLNVTNSAANSATVVGNYGTGTLTINGAGAIANLAGPLVLGANGSGTGTVNFTAGELRIGMVTRGAGTGTFNWNGGTLRPFNANAVVSNSLPLTLTGPGTSFNTLDAFGTARTITVLSVIGENGGSYGITKNGDGTLILAANSTYTGPTVLNAGTLQLGNAGASGSIPDTALTVPSGAWLAFNRTGAYTNWITLSGAGGLVQKSGTLVITNANSYTGPTVVTGSILTLQNNAALGSTTNLTVLSNGQVRLDGGLTITGVPAFIAGNGNDLMGAIASFNSTNYWNSPITLSADSRVGASNGMLIVNGVIDSGANNYALTIRGAAVTDVVVLNTNNIYKGSTTLLAGRIVLGIDNALPTDTLLIMGNSSGVASLILDLAGYNQRVAGIADYSGNNINLLITNTAATLATVTISNDLNQTFSGAIRSAIGLLKLGSATQTLSGANSYTGPTTIADGVLQLSGTGLLGTGPITNNAVLVFNRSGTYSTLAGPITGTGAVVNASSNPVYLNTANTYSGGTYLNSNGGRFGAVNDNAFGTGPIVVNGNFAIISSSGAVTRTLANNLIFSNNVQLTLSSTDTGALILNGTVGLGGATRNLLVFNTVTLNGVIDDGGLTKTGTGTLVLSASNTFAGPVTVQQGNLRLQNSYALGTGPKTVTIIRTPSEIQFQGSITTPADTTFVTSGNGTNLHSLSGTNTILGQIQLTGGAGDTAVQSDSGLFTLAGGVTNIYTAGIRNLQLQGTGIGIVSGPIVDGVTTNITGLKKQGTGIWQLTGTNTYTGVTLVTGGILQADFGVGLPATTNITLDVGTMSSPTGLITNFLGTGAAQINIVSNSSGGFSAYNVPLTVNLNNGADLTWGTPEFAPSMLVLNASAANTNLTFANNLDLNGGDRNIRVSAAVATITGVLTNGALTKTGEGLLVLAATNAQTSTTIKQGTLRLGLPEALPAASGLVLGDSASTANAGTLDLNGFNATVSSLIVTNLSGNNATVTNGIINSQTFTLSSAATGTVFYMQDGTHLELTGGGTFNINAPTGNIFIWGRRSTTVYGGLDLTQQSSFNATADTIVVGYDLSNTYEASRSGVLALAPTNSITANTFYVGRSRQNGTVWGLLLLGYSNVLNVANFNIASSKGSGAVAFNPSVTGGVLVLQGTNGTRANVTIGNIDQSTAASPSGYMMITNGNSIVAQVEQLLIAAKVTSGSGGNIRGTFTFNDGDVNANTVVIGRSTVSDGFATGTLTMNGGAMTVNNAFTIAHRTSGVATGAFLQTSGTATIYTNITDGGGVSALTLDGGTLDLRGNNIGSGANPIDTLTLASGTLRDVAEINGGSNVFKTTAGALTLLGTNAWTGATIIQAGTLRVAGWLPNSALTVANTGTLSGSGTISGSVLVDGGLLSPGNSIGTLTVGNLTLTNNPTLYFDLAAGGVSDRVIVTNVFTFSNMETNWFVLNDTGSGPDTYTLFSALSLDGTGLGANTNFYSIPGSGRSGYLFLEGTNVRLEVVPEPGASALVVAGLALVFLVRRRR